MADSAQVLAYLRPQGGYIQVGGTYEGIEFTDCEPFTKEEYEAAFEQYDAWVIQQKQEAQAKRQALLDKLGITDEEAKLLLSNA